MKFNNGDIVICITVSKNAYTHKPVIGSVHTVQNEINYMNLNWFRSIEDEIPCLIKDFILLKNITKLDKILYSLEEK
jgi:hypothetical protein